ncbi:MAG TPA: PAS domain S-box protein, partial [Syntrophorhabdales bacterium]|nr:PAS domain S-box protein [Syntrophorhabdales bacterium]
MNSKVKKRNDTTSKSIPVVGIGASAGGFDALEAFLAEMPEDFGFAIVFIQHLSPNHESLLPDLLRSRRPELDVDEISDGFELLPGKLYVCPPGKEVRIEKGTFHISSRPEGHTHLPIDEFFTSLAGDIAGRTIAVILSGAGTDGASGIQAVRKAGGTVFVQDPATAEFPAMPLAAIDTEVMDAVLSPADIAREILKLHGSGVVSVTDLASLADFEAFYQAISEKTGYRFNHYKKSVVARRIRRRMYLHGVSSVGAYLEMLGKNDSEAPALASDLMIGVTSFFRDKISWKALHLEVTRKLALMEDDTPVRVWTPACATGEEAYSIAMMLQHELDMSGRRREIQVFATDVNDRALETAREGTYPASIASDVPPEYVTKFFTPSGDGLSLTINKDIRQRIVFAKQDLLTDPPFSRLDLVICRNLLIYLEPDAQEKCIALFHYALKPGGYLFLGNAESPGRGNTLFTTLAHKKCRVYRALEVREPARMPLVVPFAGEHPAPPPARQAGADLRQSLTEYIHQALLEEFAPAAVAITQAFDIIFNTGPTHRYLRQPYGAPTQNLLDLLPKHLHNRVRAALYRASEEMKPVSIRTNMADEGGRKRQVAIRISKLRENVFLATFKEKGGIVEEAGPPEGSSVEETATRQLESELSATRDSLQSNIEQLKSLNEELHSSNEELQAANEELETSREELQSLNEELVAVNTQLQTKIEEQDETNNDLNNLLTSTSIPTIFLDYHFRVRRFTPAMSKLIKLIASDVGRPIIDMSRENLGPDLISDAQSVLDQLAPVRREFSIDGAWYVRTTLPYRTSSNRIEGVVVTYTDISERKLAELSLSESEERLRLLVEGVQDYAIFMLDEHGRVASWNSGAERIKGWKEQEILGQNFSRFYPPELIEQDLPRRELEIATAAGQYHEEGQRLRKDGSRFWVDVTITALRTAEGRLRGFAKLVHDITERKEAENKLRESLRALEESENFYREVGDMLPYGIWINRYPEGDNVFLSQCYLDMVGMTREEHQGYGWKTTLHPDDREAYVGKWLDFLKSGRTDWEEEFRVRDKEGAYRTILSRGRPIRNKEGRIIAYGGVNFDITERKAAEERIRHLASFPELNPSPVLEVDASGKITFCNTGTPETLEGLGMDRGDCEAFLPEDLGSILQDWDRQSRSTLRREALLGARVFEETIHLVPEFGAARIYAQDVTERRQAEAEREMAAGFLRILNEKGTKEELIRDTITFFQEKSGCEAVGIRLKDGDDYPYYEARGFPKEFLLLENSVCSRDAAGEALCDSLGYPIMECMCGNVIQGRFDPSKPFFSPRGSFWSNCTTELLATSTEEDRQTRTRNRCNGEGYESVALIALRTGEETFGLLQLNDRRKDRFSPRLIDLWERLADNLSVALAKAEAEAAVRTARDELELRVAERTAEVEKERRRLYDVLETLPAMICLLTPDHHVAFANRSFREKFGEAKGRHCYEYCFGFPQPCDFCESYKVLETGKPHHWQVTTPDSSSVIDAHDFPFTDADGSPLILEMDLDITEQRQAETALRLASAYNRSLIEASLDPLVTISPEGRISDVNAATEQATGYSRDELIGTDFSDYFTNPEKARAGYRKVFDE